jgi:hypothetical protein
MTIHVNLHSKSLVHSFLIDIVTHYFNMLATIRIMIYLIEYIMILLNVNGLLENCQQFLNPKFLAHTFKH